MSDHSQVNRADQTAPLRNVAAFSTLVQELVETPFGVDRMGMFSGEPGLGKTKAATKGASMYRARYVECGMTTTARSLLVDILFELGVQKPKGSINDLKNEAIYRLAGDANRPLIIDEAHHVANKRFIDVVRELHDKSRAPVILIGEETLPKRLQLFPQVLDRVLVEVTALPCNEADYRILAKTFCPKLSLSQDLGDCILRKTRGGARRIVANLFKAITIANRLGVDALDLAAFGGDREVLGSRLLEGRA